MMTKPILLIVNGPPGAGKTALGRRLAHDLNLPFFNKDDIKEILFDILGWSDKQWSQRLGHASTELLFHLAKCELEAGRSVIVETAFRAEFHNERFRDLIRRYDCQVVQIYCSAPAGILFERFVKRVESGKRHPGHVDHLISRDQFDEMLRCGTFSPLEIDNTIEVDTSNFDCINYAAIAAAIIPKGATDDSL